MLYEDNYLRNWFLERPALKISLIEENSEIPKDSLRHFLKDRRPITKENLIKLKKEIVKYGYVNFNEE